MQRINQFNLQLMVFIFQKCIDGNTPEETMRNMGLIASPGMVGTEKTIVEIFEDKLKK